MLYLGASAAPEHVRQDHRCFHEVHRRRVLRQGRRDSSPSAPPSVVLELRLDRLRNRNLPPLPAASRLRRRSSSHRRRARTPTCSGRLFPRHRYFQLTLFSTNAHNYCVFVVILYSNRTGRPLLFPSTAGDDDTYNTDLSARRFQTTALSVCGDRYSFLVHSAYVPACFRRDHRGPFRLGSDGVRRHSRDPGCLATGRGGCPVTVDTGTGWTQPTQPMGGATPVAGGATPAGGATLDPAGSSQVAMATPSPDQLGPRVVRAPNPLDVRPGPQLGWR
jgi:hypothetical protein